VTAQPRARKQQANAPGAARAAIRQDVDFRELCHKHGLAATHQRAVIYQAVMSMHGHPSPEQIYERVHRQIPSMSLATVYKTLNAFIAAGIVHEVSLHHRSLRIDPNSRPHHHLVCTECRSIEDIDDEKLDGLAYRGPLPKGFHVQRYSIEVHGVCGECSKKR